jgi:hypothetical protein
VWQDRRFVSHAPRRSRSASAAEANEGGRMSDEDDSPPFEHDMGYYILDGHTPVHVPSNGMEATLTWGRWLEEHRAERIVQQEQIGPYWISTVFLGMDHGFHRIFGVGAKNPHPILFETMAFVVVGTERTLNVQERYSTWDEALAGHERLAAAFRKAVAG